MPGPPRWSWEPVKRWGKQDFRERAGLWSSCLWEAEAWMTGRRAYKEMSAKDKGERTKCRLDASGLTPAEGGKEGGKAESPSVCCVAPREGSRGPVGSPGAKTAHGRPARGRCGPWGSHCRGARAVCAVTGWEPPGGRGLGVNTPEDPKAGGSPGAASRDGRSQPPGAGVPSGLRHPLGQQPRPPLRAVSELWDAGYQQGSESRGESRWSSLEARVIRGLFPENSPRTKGEGWCLRVRPCGNLRKRLPSLARLFPYWVEGQLKAKSESFFFFFFLFWPDQLRHPLT